MTRLPVVAVDVGNARVKLGLFPAQIGEDFPEPVATLGLDGLRPEWSRIGGWLTEIDQRHVGWWIGSVSRPTTRRLLDWIRQHRPADPISLLAASDVPLRVEIPRPDTVGVDRLLDAVAANHLRPPARPAVVVDVGTAITVDLVSADGAFRGGAILPGIAMSARAMHEYTDLLPLTDMAELSTPPPALGTATVSAIHSGLFWGGVGAIRFVVEQLADRGKPQVVLTGGAGPAVAELLGHPPGGTSSASPRWEVRHVPHLTLAGIALTANAASD